MRKFLIVVIIVLTFSIPLLKIVFAESNGIVINEIMPDPTGTDSGKEWIELYNNSSQIINLKDFTIVSESSSGTQRKLVLPSYELEPQNYLIIAEDSVLFAGTNKIVVGAGKINMFNSQAKVIIFDSNNNILDTANYSTVNEGKSLERQGPNCSNLIINMTGSSIGLVNLNYSSTCWSPVSYPISYLVSYPASYPNSNPISYVSSPISYNIPPSEQVIGKTLQISEAYPNPDTGDHEWVEIYNYGNYDINLDGYYFMDRSGTRSELDGVVLARNYIVIGETKLKLSLNNDGDDIYLFTPEGELLDSLKYSKSEKNLAAVKIMLDGKYLTEPTFEKFTTFPTPGKDNKLILAEVLTKPAIVTKQMITNQLDEEVETEIIQNPLKDSQKILGSLQLKHSTVKPIIERTTSKMNLSAIILLVLICMFMLLIIELANRKLFNSHFMKFREYLISRIEFYKKLYA